MWITFFPSLIAVVSITICQIGSGFVCLSPDRPTPVCLTYRSDHIFSHNGWNNARNCKFWFQLSILRDCFWFAETVFKISFSLSRSHSSGLSQRIEAEMLCNMESTFGLFFSWRPLSLIPYNKQLYYQPDDEWQLTEHLGIGYWCKDMNPAEQCLEQNPQPPMPYKKSKRYLPVDEVVSPPENQYDPDCILIAHGNGDNGSPATLPEIHSDGIDDNQPQSQYYNNNGNQLSSEDEGNNIQASNSFAANDIDTFNPG